MTKEEKAAYNKKWNEENKERKAAYNKKWREVNKEKTAAYQKNWIKKNKELGIIYKPKYSEDDREKAREYANNYRKNNPEKVSAYFKKYRKDNSAKCSENANRARSAKLQRIPSWQTDQDVAIIAYAYRVAKGLTDILGIPHDVDHDYPLQGELVSGLHTPGNLRVLPASVNRSKGNKYTPD